MPKIKLTELDETRTSLSGVDNIVFMPFEVLTGETFKPTLVSTVTELKAVVTNTAYQVNDNSSWFMITSLLAAGMKILVQGVTQLSEVDWTKTGLADKTLYDIRFLTAGALSHWTEEGEGVFTDDGTNVSMMTCAALRGDCVALCDHPLVLDTAKAIRDYFGTPAEAIATFGAAFTPACQFTTTTLDSEGKSVGVTLTLPASFAFLRAYAVSSISNPSWFAIAGTARGSVPGLLRPIVDFGSAAIDKLQARADELDGENDNVGFAINPICYIRPFGYLIWGNRTLRVNDGTKALSFLNVRNLVSELKKVLFKAARTVTFEPNSELLWVKFTALIYPTLEKMVSGNGISGYRLIKEPTDAKARLKASVRIYPIEAVEDFELSVILEDEDAQVSINE